MAWSDISKNPPLLQSSCDLPSLNKGNTWKTPRNRPFTIDFWVLSFDCPAPSDVGSRGKWFAWEATSTSLMLKPDVEKKKANLSETENLWNKCVKYMAKYTVPKLSFFQKLRKISLQDFGGKKAKTHLLRPKHPTSWSMLRKLRSGFSSPVWQGISQLTKVNIS